MEKVRICELRVGDEFEMDGLGWRVTSIADGVTSFAQFRSDRPYWSRWGGGSSRGSRSQQFVYLIKRAYEQTSGMVVQEHSVQLETKDSGIRPGKGGKDDHSGGGVR